MMSYMSQWICSFFFVYSIDLTLNSVILQFKSIIEPLSEFCIIVMFNSKIATQFLRYLFLILMILMVIILHLHMASFCSLNMFVVPDLTSYLLKCDIWSSHRQFLSLFFILCIDSPSCLDACLSIFCCWKMHILENVFCVSL